MTDASTPERSRERLRAHYEIEKELANKLRTSTWNDRKRLYGDVYRELLQRVYDHPMLTQTESPEATGVMVGWQMKLLTRFLERDSTFLEIGPGDGALSREVGNHVDRVVALDVSAEATRGARLPDNCSFTLYDGVHIPLRDDSVDVAYSSQVIEHLHPQDAIEQTSEVRRVLRPGGLFICLTVNRLSGPHDISCYFDTVATGLHLKEYTNIELDSLLRKVGFSRVRMCIGVRGRYIVTRPAWARGCERLLIGLPRSIRRPAATSLRSVLGIRLVASK